MFFLIFCYIYIQLKLGMFTFTKACGSNNEVSMQTSNPCEPKSQASVSGSFFLLLVWDQKDWISLMWPSAVKPLCLKEAAKRKKIDKLACFRQRIIWERQGQHNINKDCFELQSLCFSVSGSFISFLTSSWISFTIIDVQQGKFYGTLATLNSLIPPCHLKPPRPPHYVLLALLT